MNKCFYVIALTCLASFQAMAQEEEVYRWVDENGNVHYADQPKSANAKRFILRNNNYAKPAVDAQDLQRNNEALAAINTSNSDDGIKQSPVYNKAEDNAYPEQSCEYLRTQMEAAKLDLNNNDLDVARKARIFLDTADKMLADGQCN